MAGRKKTYAFNSVIFKRPQKCFNKMHGNDAFVLLLVDILSYY